MLLKTVVPLSYQRIKHYIVYRLKSIMLQNFPIILPFFLPMNYAHNSYYFPNYAHNLNIIYRVLHCSISHNEYNTTVIYDDFLKICSIIPEYSQMLSLPYAQNYGVIIDACLIVYVAMWSLVTVMRYYGIQFFIRFISSYSEMLQ